MTVIVAVATVAVTPVRTIGVSAVSAASPIAKPIGSRASIAGSASARPPSLAAHICVAAAVALSPAGALVAPGAREAGNPVTDDRQIDILGSIAGLLVMLAVGAVVVNLASTLGEAFGIAEAFGLAWAIGEVLAWHRQPELWAALRQNGMAEDFSWRHQAPLYEGLYARLTGSG